MLETSNNWILKMLETSNASNIPGGHIVEITRFQLGGVDLPTIPILVAGIVGKSPPSSWNLVISTDNNGIFSAMKADEITRIGVYEFWGSEGLRESNEGTSLWYNVKSNQEKKNYSYHFT